MVCRSCRLCRLLQRRMLFRGQQHLRLQLRWDRPPMLCGLVPALSICTSRHSKRSASRSHNTKFSPWCWPLRQHLAGRGTVPTPDRPLMGAVQMMRSLLPRCLMHRRRSDRHGRVLWRGVLRGTVQLQLHAEHISVHRAGAMCVPSRLKLSPLRECCVFDRAIMHASQ